MLPFLGFARALVAEADLGFKAIVVVTRVLLLMVLLKRHLLELRKL